MWNTNLDFLLRPQSKKVMEEVEDISDFTSDEEQEQKRVAFHCRRKEKPDAKDRWPKGSVYDARRIASADAAAAAGDFDTVDLDDSEDDDRRQYMKRRHYFAVLNQRAAKEEKGKCGPGEPVESHSHVVSVDPTRLGTSSCTCKDFVYRRIPCKHIYYIVKQSRLKDTSLMPDYANRTK